MDSAAARVTLHPFTAEEALRVVERTASDSDAWAADYPFEDELAPLQSFATRRGSGPDDHPFTLYRIDETSSGLAIGGLGFFYEPNEDGTTELGYGLVASARGKGYATEALRLAVAIARSAGAKRIIADTAVDNVASQNVMVKAGFTETSRTAELIDYAIEL